MAESVRFCTPPATGSTFRRSSARCFIYSIQVIIRTYPCLLPRMLWARSAFPGCSWPGV